MRSIRLYLVAVLLAVICIASFIAALKGYQQSLAQANLLLDGQLQNMANLLDRSDRQTVGPVLADGWMLQIIATDEIAQHSDSSLLPLLNLASGFHDVNYEGNRWRVLSTRAASNDRVIIVGLHSRDYRDLGERIVLQAVQPFIWMVPVLGLLVWFIVGTGLSPMRRLANELQRRRADDLTIVNGDGYPSELNQVVVALNQLFERLNQAYEREKQLTADVAHELRTPIAALKIQLHNLEVEGAASEELEEVRVSVQRIGHAIDQILAINRVTADSAMEARTLLNLESETQTILADLDVQLSRRQQTIELFSEPCEVVCDRTSFLMLIRNLIDNASKYSPPGADIRVTLTHNAPWAVLTVEDSGPGIAESERKQALQRFYRARQSSDVTGSGLGLAIASDVASLHDGSISLDSSEDLGGLKVTVKLPLAPEIESP